LYKTHIFFKCNPKDIRTNVFDKHTKPSWEANIDAQFILDPYAAKSYYTSYLTKVNKIVDQKMHSILNKCKHEQTQASKCIKKLGNAFLNAQQISNQQAIRIMLSNIFTIQQDHFNSQTHLKNKIVHLCYYHKNSYKPYLEIHLIFIINH
jgi:hypothetical protein